MVEYELNALIQVEIYIMVTWVSYEWYTKKSSFGWDLYTWEGFSNQTESSGRSEWRDM